MPLEPTPLFFLYELQLQNIRCTSCAKRITSSLTNSHSILEVKVNILTEKLLITLTDISLLPSIQLQLSSLGFECLSEPTEINISAQNSEKREIFFILEEISSAKTNIDAVFEGKPGILSIQIRVYPHRKTYLQLKIQYNPLITKGRWIYDQLSQIGFNGLEVLDPYLDNFKSKNLRKKGISGKDLIFAIVTVIFFIFLALILPFCEFLSSMIVYPESFNIISIYTIFMFFITIMVMLKFGRKTFLSSIFNFYKYKSLNMESLITLGSLSSFFMALFLLVAYCIENYSKTVHLLPHVDIILEKRKQILMIVEMLETTALILSIITIGKYLEDKAKFRILKMTEELFPENQLLQTLELEYIEPKNRNFLIEAKKKYEVSLLDRDDLIEVKGPMRLLLDAVVVHVYDDYEGPSETNNNNKKEIKNKTPNESYDNNNNKKLDNNNNKVLNEKNDKNIKKDSTNLKIIDSVSYGQNDAFYPQKGDRIKSGAEILSGHAILQIENEIENSVLTQMSRQLNLVQNSIETNENGINVLFSGLAAIFVKIIIGLAFLTLVVWLVLIGMDIFKVEQYCRWCFPFERAISVLVASCPCALGLAIPSVIVISLNLAMKNGILIKKSTFFEKINKVNAVVFDKTGTLFTKDEEIYDYKLVGGLIFNEEELWQILLILEKGSHHPLGRLLYKEAIRRIKTTVFNVNFIGLEKPKFNKNGLSCKIQSKNKEINSSFTAYIGNKYVNPALLLEEPIEKEIVYHETLGRTSLLFSIGSQLFMIIYFDNSTNLRPEAKNVISYLQFYLHKEVFILSGDSSSTINQIGCFLNIPLDHLFGDIDAQSKKNFLQKLKNIEHKEVMMIGDGLNDVLSIQEAAVGVSINSKSELNIMASDVVVLSENLWKIVFLFDLSRFTKIFIIVNLCWAFGYNLLMIPIAAGVFSSAGIMIPPFISSLAMSLSSLLVVLFSNFMRCVRLERKSFEGEEEIVELKKNINNKVDNSREMKEVGDIKWEDKKTATIPMLGKKKDKLCKMDEVL